MPYKSAVLRTNNSTTIIISIITVHGPPPPPCPPAPPPHEGIAPCRLFFIPRERFFRLRRVALPDSPSSSFMPLCGATACPRSNSQKSIPSKPNPPPHPLYCVASDPPAAIVATARPQIYPFLPSFPRSHHHPRSFLSPLIAIIGRLLLAPRAESMMDASPHGISSASSTWWASAALFLRRAIPPPFLPPSLHDSVSALGCCVIFFRIYSVGWLLPSFYFFFSFLSFLFFSFFLCRNLVFRVSHTRSGSSSVSFVGVSVTGRGCLAAFPLLPMNFKFWVI